MMVLFAQFPNETQGPENVRKGLKVAMVVKTWTQFKALAFMRRSWLCRVPGFAAASIFPGLLPGVLGGGVQAQTTDRDRERKG